MNIKFIKTNREYKIALNRIEELWGGFYKTKPEANELETLLTLVEKYEEEHYRLLQNFQIA
ncbi:MAG: transcriptional regulator [Ignavibacteriae bacterium]|nr:MAG: transcriptional regulator [Ignavibacteriota bacterium]